MRKYQAIQYLRAVAALAVVFHHARNPLPGFFDPLTNFGLGQAGVDIFFVISGFIMYSAASRETPAEFGWRRFVRLAPLYWLATILTAVIAIRHGGLAPTYLEHLIKSLAFIPSYSLDFPGYIWPCLAPGWTLNYEVFFYLLFALGLALGHVFETVTIAIVVLAILGLLFPSHDALWTVYSNPLLLEFLGGLVIARYQDRIIRPWAALLLPIGVVALALGTPHESPRILLWGLPAMAIVAGALAIERSGRLPDIRAMTILGDASYSIYLFQLFGIRATEIIVRKLPLAGMTQFLVMVLASLAACTALGLTAHYVLERPVLRLLRKRRGPGRQDALAAP